MTKTVTPFFFRGGDFLATTRLMPLHAGAGRTSAAALGRSVDYVENPGKTEGGELVTAYECDPLTAAQEFAFSKREYAALTGRDQGDRDVIAYHLRQSFKPGEIDPAAANQIGYDLAMSLTKGKHAFLVCTHVDKAHIHSHIIFNSTSLDCDRKFRNFIGSSFAVRRISDRLCAEHGLSIVENPKPSRGSYGTWLGDAKPLSQRGKLRTLIDGSISVGAYFDDFVAAMERADCEVKQGKYLAFKLPGAQKFIRSKSLGDDYTEDAIRERLAGTRAAQVRTASIVQGKPEKVNLLIDIQQKIQQARTPGFERFAKIYNLKEAARTLIFLQEHGLTDYDELDTQASAASNAFHDLSAQIKAVESRMTKIAELQKHIGNYTWTLDVFRQYKASGYSKNFYEEHTADLMLHRAAKKHFDETTSGKAKKLPTIKALRQEYAVLLADKKKLYASYKQKKESMMQLQIMKHNVDRILHLSDPARMEREQEVR